jgi:hypothetical protein
MTNENNTEQRAEATPKRRTFLGCGVCVWIAVGGFSLLLLVLLLLPAVNAPREAARRMKCYSNLRNIMVAMNCYHTKYGCYPPAYTVDKQGRRIHSWRALLLEFLDRDLYAEYDFSRPWNSPGNLAVADTMKQDGPYRCPSEQLQSPLNTSYVMLVGPAAFSDGPTGRKPEEITDGLANTIAVVEMSPSGIGWTAPYDLNVSEMSFKINDPNQAGPRSCHPNIAYLLFADGNARIAFSQTMFPPLLKAFVTINGGEDVKYPD